MKTTLKILAGCLVAFFFNLPASGQRILFVGGDPGPTDEGDPFVLEFLVERYGEANVDYIGSGDSQSGDELEYTALLVSSTIASGTARGKFHDSPIPIVNWETALVRDAEGEFAMSAGGMAEDSEHSIVIEQDHPITAGFDVGSTVIMTDEAAPFSWWFADHAPGALALARDDDDEESIFMNIIEKGDELLDGSPAPGRRVMIALENTTFEFLTEDGRTLFGQAVDWALGIAKGSTFQITSIRWAGDGVSLTWHSKLGTYYAVETSSDLVNWENLVTEYPEGGATEDAVSYTDRDISAAPGRFYRVRQVPRPPLYTTDFEKGAEGWIAFNDGGATEWELGTPNADGITAASSGSQTWGTNIAGDYTPSSAARLRSPVIDVSGGSSRLSLNFNFYNDTTPDLEGTVINFLDENGGVLASLNGPDDIISGQTDGWQPFSVRFPDQALGGRVMIEFQFLADGDDEVGAGTYIDDVIID